MELEDGRFATMEDLRVGDRIKVAERQFSAVFMFTHNIREGMRNFIGLSTTNGASLLLTKGHYLFINGRLSAASKVNVGDWLVWGAGGPTTVKSISKTRSRRLYNPQTVDGKIAVDDIRASAYTSSVYPLGAHPLLAPFRAIYNSFGVYHSLR